MNEQMPDWEKAYRSIESALEKNSEAKRGIEGVTNRKPTAEERKERSGQDSENKRALRELRRAEVTGRISNWLRRYSERKESEFNSENAVLQNSPQRQSSVTYTPSETPTITQQTSEGGGRRGVGGGGGENLPVGIAGNILRHNGTEWVAIPTPDDPPINDPSLFVNSATGYEWLAGADNGDIVYYDGDNRSWNKLSAPQSGTHVLGIVDGTLEWIATQDCEEEE